MDHIHAHLTTLGCDTKKHSAAIHLAVALARKTLNWYYSLTDRSDIYQIAMSKSCSFITIYSS